MEQNGTTADPNPAVIKDASVSFIVHTVFITSGMAALFYQMIWQRSLMNIYGCNVESVAMVVSAFMVGLGLGSLAGGAISKCRGMPLVLLFSASEFLIGLYGLCSLQLFHWVGTYTLHAGTLATGLYSFALVFIPTLFMGMTLPLLFAYQVNRIGHVGKSVSWLYFVNTLGAGIGAFAAAYIFLGRYGMSGTVKVAALLNGISGMSVLMVWLIKGRNA